MKTFWLMRKEDVSGMSGTGRVAEVAVFSDGTAVLRWEAPMNAAGVSSTVIYSCVEDLVRIHGHDGRTYLEEQ
jgi:hypothetical protein